MMSIASAALWFSISFVMHLIYGLVLGIVTSYGVGGVVWDSRAWFPRVFTSRA
jgi:hypothetical protein